MYRAPARVPMRCKAGRGARRPGRAFIRTYTLQARPGKSRAGACLRTHIYASGRSTYTFRAGPGRRAARAAPFIHTCALQLHTYIYTSASYIHIHFRSDPENAGPVRSPGRAFMRTYTLQAGPGLRAARAAPSCIHVHFSFIYTYTLQLHTYIYTSASYIHIHFRSARACSGPRGLRGWLAHSLPIPPPCSG